MIELEEVDCCSNCKHVMWGYGSIFGCRYFKVRGKDRVREVMPYNKCKYYKNNKLGD